MKNNVFKITAGNKFQAVIVFLRGQLGIKASDPLVSLARAAPATLRDGEGTFWFEIGLSAVHVYQRSVCAGAGRHGREPFQGDYLETP